MSNLARWASVFLRNAISDVDVLVMCLAKNGIHSFVGSKLDMIPTFVGLCKQAYFYVML